MVKQLSCRLVFLASPGGLGEERMAARAVFAEYHATRSVDDEATFYVHAWEDVSGGVGRPQELINRNLEECDFFVLLLGDTWGSPPDNDGTYSSGTEEEFYRALELLADPSSPMRDILVLFKAIDVNRLRDPGEKLKLVLNFRDRLEQAKQLLYENFDSTGKLRAVMERKVRQWSGPLGDKVPVDITIPKAQTEEGQANDSLSQQQLLELAREKARLGLRLQAEIAYSKAVADGDPVIALEYARFMRRTGRLDAALELNRSVLEDASVLASAEPSMQQAVTQALSNTGVILRKQGKIAASVQALEEAVSTARAAATSDYVDLCYALDNLGLSLVRGGEQARAEEVLQEAYDRRPTADTVARAQSAANLAHLLMAQGRATEARGYFDDAIAAVGDQEAHVLANALCGAAEARLELGELDEVADLVNRALELNINIANSDGISIASALRARLALEQDDFSAAETSISRAREQSDVSGNGTGKGVVACLEARLALLTALV